MKYYADISRYRPVTDWNFVKKNCPFLISKATEGTDYTDPTLDAFRVVRKMSFHIGCMPIYAKEMNWLRPSI